MAFLKMINWRSIFRPAFSDNEEKEMDLPLADRTFQLPLKDYLYALSLYRGHPWLKKRAEGLEGTIFYLVSKVNGARPLFKSLIKRFQFVSTKESDKRTRLIVDRIRNKWKCPKDTTIIMAFCKNSNKHGDGSQKLLDDIKKELTEWNENRFFSFFDTTNPRLSKGYNIVLVDDFVGTGGTMDNRITDLENVISPGAKIYIVSLGAMEISKKYLKNHPQVNFYSPCWCESVSEIKLNLEKHKIMQNLENLLSPRYKSYDLDDFSFGYKKSCALYFNERFRIPNNVFPILWWGKLKDKKHFKSLFLRT